MEQSSLAPSDRGIEASTQGDDALERRAQTRNIRRDFWLGLGTFVAARASSPFSPSSSAASRSIVSWPGLSSWQSSARTSRYPLLP
jgi:hypothetical protein